MRKTLIGMVAAALSLVAFAAQGQIRSEFYDTSRELTSSNGRPLVEVTYNNATSKGTAHFQARLVNTGCAGAWVKVRLIWGWHDGCCVYHEAFKDSDPEYLEPGGGTGLFIGSAVAESSVWQAGGFWMDIYTSNSENGQYVREGVLNEFFAAWPDYTGGPELTTVSESSIIDLCGNAPAAFVIPQLDFKTGNVTDTDYRVRIHVQNVDPCGNPIADSYTLCWTQIGDAPWKHIAAWGVSNGLHSGTGIDANLQMAGGTLNIKVVLEQYTAGPGWGAVDTYIVQAAVEDNGCP
jgi:hypothetical protein